MRLMGRFPLIVSGTLFGTITVFDRWLSDRGFSVLEISLFPIVFSAVILLPFALRHRKEMLQPVSLRFYASVGLVLATLSAVEVAGIALGTHIAIAALLLYTEPVWTIIFGSLFLGERITTQKSACLLLAMTGVFLMLRPDDIALGPPAGLILSFLSGILLSLFVTLSRGFERYGHPFVPTSFGATVGTIAWLLLFMPLSWLLPESGFYRLSVDFPPTYWLLFFLFALVSDLVPNLFFFKGMRTQEASSAGIILILEPLSAILMASFLFADPLTEGILLGGGMILAANGLLLARVPKTEVVVEVEAIGA
jgi:drug/metabolite transporter, DME family